MKIEERQVILRLREAIGCPVKWNERFDNPQFCKDLRLYWIRVAENFETDGEMRFYSRLDVERALDEGWLGEIEKNTEFWRPRAIKRYADRAGFLFNLHFATENDQKKHYPHPKWTKLQTIERTLRGDALFYKRFAPELLMNIVFWCIHQRLVNVLDGHPHHLYLDGPEEIGASKGQTTRLVRFDLDYNTPRVHGHPILASELPTATDVIEDASYAFSDEVYDEFYHDIDEPDDTNLTPRSDNSMS